MDIHKLDALPPSSLPKVQTPGTAAPAPALPQGQAQAARDRLATGSPAATFAGVDGGLDLGALGAVGKPEFAAMKALQAKERKTYETTITVLSGWNAAHQGQPALAEQVHAHERSIAHARDQLAKIDDKGHLDKAALLAHSGELGVSLATLGPLLAAFPADSLDLADYKRLLGELPAHDPLLQPQATTPPLANLALRPNFAAVKTFQQAQVQRLQTDLQAQQAWLAKQQGHPELAGVVKQHADAVARGQALVVQLQDPTHIDDETLLAHHADFGLSRATLEKALAAYHGPLTVADYTQFLARLPARDPR